MGGLKQSNNDLNSLCINGSHVYTEETKSSSTVSLNSIGQGSVDVLKHTSDADSIQVSSLESDREQQCHLQQEEKRQREETCIAETKRLEEKENYRLEAKRPNEENECRSHEELGKSCMFDEQLKKQIKEEEESRKQEKQLKMLKLGDNQRLEEEYHREEEKQEEVSMSERLTSLFGIIRKKKEESHQDIEVEPPTQAPLSDYSQPISHHSTNPFEDIPLNSDLVATSGSQKDGINHQIPSARVFLNRTAKVSAVKPRYAFSVQFLNNILNNTVVLVLGH